MEKYKNGFTLAEVLIVLAIIGVIAALTIPTLVKNYQKQQTVVGLQKMYTTINQSVKISEVENGSMTNWGNPTTEWNAGDSRAWWDTYFLPYSNLSVNKVCSGADASKCWPSDSMYLDGKPLAISTTYVLVLNDGSLVYLGPVSNTSAEIYVDINGFKKPNVMGKDIFFVYILYKEGMVAFPGYNVSRTYLSGNHDNCCNQLSGVYKGRWCGALLQMDGWKISDDYPWD